MAPRLAEPHLLPKRGRLRTSCTAKRRLIRCLCIVLYYAMLCYICI